MGLRPAWPFTAGIALSALASLVDAMARVPSACIRVHLRLQFLACFLACRTRPQGRPAAALMPEPHAPVRTAANHRTAGHAALPVLRQARQNPMHLYTPSPTGHAARLPVQTWRQNPMHLRNWPDLRCPPSRPESNETMVRFTRNGPADNPIDNWL
jgi:hypothetical protein